MTGIHELIIVILLIVVLSGFGVWPVVVRGLRELRGEQVPPQAPGKGKDDAELSFRLMGISPSATWTEIEQAYRKKAKLHHPDLGGDEDAMRALNEAYNLLKKIRKH